MCARDIEPIKQSKYVMECCQVLLEDMQYPSDIAAVHLVRLHGVAGRISQGLFTDGWNHPLGFNSAPIGACVKGLESDLMQLKISPAEGIIEHSESIRGKTCRADLVAVLSIHYYTVEVFLYEIALSDTIETERYGTYPFARLNMLYACLNSVRLLFDQVQAISASEWYNIPYTTWTVVGHAIVVLSRLSLCKAEGWNKDYNRGIVDFATMVDALIQKFEVDRDSITSEGEEPRINLPEGGVPPQVFLMISTKLRHIKDAQEAKYAAQIEDLGETSGSFCPNLTTTFMADELGLPPSTALFDFFDENFWPQFA